MVPHYPAEASQFDTPLRNAYLKEIDGIADVGEIPRLAPKSLKGLADL